MKLATLKTDTRDGQLIVVSRDHARAARVPQIAPTLQAAIEDWDTLAPRLEEVYHALSEGKVEGAFELDLKALHSPLPRAYQWADGSAYLNHVQLVRQARGAEMPETFWTDPLMYQGASDRFIGPYDPMEAASEDWGIDFEGEIAVVTDDVPMGVSPEQAAGHIKLLMLVNDVSLRGLIPGELAKGFGFFQSKPASSFSPIAVTPDELGDAWQEGRVHLPLTVHLNGEKFGEPQAGPDMIFSFPELVAHAARTRYLGAGAIVGSGTVSNPDTEGGPGRPVADGGVGYSCLAEIRMVEKILHGEIKSPFMRFGDRVRIEMFDGEGKSIFGAIDQEVVRYEGGVMKLYGYYRSSTSYRVRIALNLKELDYRQQPVNLLQSEHREGPYLQLNPQGLVPALETDEGEQLTQSLAICEYLEERYPEPSLLPTSAIDRARVRAIVGLLAIEIHPLNNLRVLKYLTGELGINEETKLGWYRHWIAEGFDALEAMLAGDPRTGRYCHGDQPGLADVCLVPQVYNAERFGCDLESYPTIRRIHTACNELPTFARAHPDQQPDAV